MPYRLFLAESPAPHASRVLLPEEEAHHLTRVLRLQDGAAVEALDGAGRRFLGRLADVNKRGATLVIDHVETALPLAPTVHLLVAPTKNLDRLEWLLEKATELGLTRFTPILTQRAERRELKLERLRKISIAALKQSGGTWLPALDELMALPQALAETVATQKFVAHLSTDPAERRALGPSLRADTPSVAVLIGPEGDFTADEVAQARAAGFAPVTLGTSVLRTETAALFACCAVRVVCGSAARTAVGT
jgi:16S rRNA (uracil1498-N3)-methyltransferase